MFKLTIPMRPVAKARPRFSESGCYTDEKTKAAENAIALCAMAYMSKSSIPMFDGPIFVTMEFGFAYPKNLTKLEKELIKQEKPIQHIKRPDLDNVVKLVADSLNGVAYVDDKMIVHLDAYKRYGESDYITIEIEEA